MSLRQMLSASCGMAAVLSTTVVAAQVTTGSTQAALTGNANSRTDAGQRAAPKSQDTNAGSSTAVGEVVVTAASRKDTVQTAPVAITAFTDERRNLLGIENARDITNQTPSMSLQGEYLTLRGVGRFEDPGQGADPGVAVHVDGVYTSSPAYLNQPDFLADRIEVLRGPQSVFGRNSVGGTVNVISKRPTHELSGDLRAGYTSSNLAYVDAAVAGPITDTLGYRFGYAYSDTRQGSETNVASRYGPVNTGDTHLYEAQLEWDPNKDFSFWVRYQGFSSDLTGAYGVLTQLGGGTGIDGQYFSDVPANYTSSLFFGLAPNPQFGIDPNSNPAIQSKFTTSVDYPGHIDLTNNHTVTINSTWDIHWATLKYIGGYSQYDYHASTDGDGTSRNYLTSPGGRQVPSYYVSYADQYKKWYSHELILSGPDDKRLRWVAGLYDYSERYKTAFGISDPLATYLTAPVYSATTLAPAPASPNAAFYSQLTTLRSDNQAVYGQVEFDLTSTIKLTASGRYNWDQRYGGDSFRYIFDLYGIYGDYGVPRVGLDVTPAAHGQEVHRDYSDWTGKIGAEWHPDRSLTAYVSIAKGYKPGGFNLGGFAVIPIVDKERLIDYEGGIKKQWGRTFLVDAAVYYYDYKNLQVPITVGTTSTNPVTMMPITTYSSSLGNAQKTRSYGFELESVYSPLDNLHFTLVYSYLNSRFQRFTSPVAGGVIQDPTSGINYSNLAGFTVPQSPENKVSVTPQYVFHLAQGNLSVSGTYSWTDSQYYRVFNTARDRAPSYYNLDLRAVFQPKNSHFTAILYGRNVTNSTQVIFKGPSLAFPASEYLYTVYEPASVGGEIQYRF